MVDEPDDDKIYYCDDEEPDGAGFREVAEKLVDNKKREYRDRCGIRPELVADKARNKEYLDDPVT